MTKRPVCPSISLKALVFVACSRNIDFKTGNNILDNVMDIKHIFSVIEFIFSLRNPDSGQRENVAS